MMKAHLKSNFKRGFFLTEEALIKLDDIVRKRLLTFDSAAKLGFKVFRADGMVVEFDSPGAVAAEENSSRNAVTRLELLSSGPGHRLSLEFDPKDNTGLAIESTDRDFAHLLASDIKDYVNSEVLKFRSFSFDSLLTSKSVFPFISLIFMFISLYGIKDAPNQRSVDQVLSSDDLNAKLNFLIETRVNQDARFLKWTPLAMLAAMLVLFFLGSLLDRAFPRNLFYWGKLAQTHDRLVGFREKAIWGIAISFIVGIASTVFVDYLKR